MPVGATLNPMNSMSSYQLTNGSVLRNRLNTINVFDAIYLGENVRLAHDIYVSV